MVVTSTSVESGDDNKITHISSDDKVYPRLGRYKKIHSFGAMFSSDKIIDMDKKTQEHLKSLGDIK